MQFGSSAQPAAALCSCLNATNQTSWRFTLVPSTHRMASNRHGTPSLRSAEGGAATPRSDRDRSGASTNARRTLFCRARTPVAASRYAQLRLSDMRCRALSQVRRSKISGSDDGVYRRCCWRDVRYDHKSSRARLVFGRRLSLHWSRSHKVPARQPERPLWMTPRPVRRDMRGALLSALADRSGADSCRLKAGASAASDRRKPNVRFRRPRAHAIDPKRA